MVRHNSQTIYDVTLRRRTTEETNSLTKKKKKLEYFGKVQKPRCRKQGVCNNVHYKGNLS